MINARENYLRAIEFRCPEWIPIEVYFSPATWKKYRGDLEEIVLAHHFLFPDYKKGDTDFNEMPPGYRGGEYNRDNWGCLWRNVEDGIWGQVVESPLADWGSLAGYQFPDPARYKERGERDWEKIREEAEKSRAKGFLIWGDGERLFDRLYYLRGFENLMMDFATDDPHLPGLIEMLTEHELKLVNKWIEVGVDIISFHTDIGTQNSLMISPDKFRKYIKPMFKKIFTTCRNAGTHVSLSSDGRLLEIVDDLIECGVSVHDPQFRANTLDGIEKYYKGKMCIKLDLDRQMFAFCKPEEIREQIKESVERLSSSRGGLMLYGEIVGANIPLENIEALCSGLEEFSISR